MQHIRENFEDISAVNDGCLSSPDEQGQNVSQVT
jgi:hypothetical protein